MATVSKMVVRQALKAYQSVTSPEEGMKLALEKFQDEVNKGRGYHRPVCVTCQVELHPEHNGVGVLDIANFGPVDIWDADLWKCPKCGIEIVSGFGNNPISSHYKGDEFTRLVQSYRDHSIVIESR